MSRFLKSAILGAAMLGASASWAETLMMPNRDFLRGTSEVVWGISTKANGTAYSIDYGDGSPVVNGSVADRSYIAFNKTYAAAGTFTITLTVGGEVATTTVRVFDGAVISAADLRGLRINKAIEDGLRNLWVTQSNRTTFDTTPVTSWDSSYPRTGTSLTVLAFENHGYKVPNNNGTPTGLYEKYAVQRGLNYIVSTLTQVTLNNQTAGNPCVGAGIEAVNCIGLRNTDGNDDGYATAMTSLALSGSSALSRTIPTGLGGSSGAYVAGKTLGEVLQRVMNTIAWGQVDGGAGCRGRGGWYYSLRSDTSCAVESDGSTVGWNVLALLDSAAAGINAPAFVSSEFAFALTSHGNTNGSFDYNADNNPVSTTFGYGTYQNFARAGIYLQALFYQGVPVGDARVQAAISFINARWSGVAPATDYSGSCSNSQNKGCAYGMYNAFKGLKLYGVNSIPAASDWYAEYQDYLVATQNTPTSTTGGAWTTSTMLFSCCYNSNNFGTAIAELILAPVALVTPDPTLFSTVGLTPLSAVNPLFTNHTVTAFAQATNGAPVPGATIVFRVTAGPNTGKTGTSTTGADGKTSFTYADDGGAGTDTIQAFIGNLGSNTVTKLWRTVCDVNNDGRVTQADLSLIRAKNGQAASGPNDPFDPNGDGVINVADYRYCQLRLTP